MSASLSDFRLKITNFLNHILLNPEPGQKLMSLTWFHHCFELIRTSNKAFEEMIEEIDYPMSKWSGKATDEYLSYTLNLLDLLNSISSSVSHLNRAKISILLGVNSINGSMSSASNNLKKIPRIDIALDLKMVDSVGIEGSRSGFGNKEITVLEGLMELKKIGILALGLVLSGLCSDSKPYMKARKFFGTFKDSTIEGMDSKFFSEIMETKGVVAEVENVNSAVELISADVQQLKSSIQVMEASIEVIEKDANNMFSEVVATRKKLLDTIRLVVKNH